METPSTPYQRVRFGAFEVDLRSEELRKNGTRVKLQGLPIKVLAILLARPGEMVTREDLRKELWPADTFVDFDSGLNTAIRRLREALGDSKENPRYIETLPRRGYRLIAPVERSEPVPPAISAVSAPPLRTWAGRFWRRYGLVLGAGAGALALLSIFIAGYAGGPRERLRLKPEPPPAAQWQIQSLAVLPLENLSANPNQEYLADGMTEELTTDLAKISTLKVISLSSTMRFEGTKKPLREIAGDLKVDAVVEGSVERSGNRVRINVQLIDGASGEYLWAESYERDFRDALSLQSEVARAIAGEIRVKLTTREKARLAKVGAVDAGAEEAYLRGHYELSMWTNDGFKKGFDYFEQALQRDPRFAEAWAGLSEAYFDLGQSGVWPLQETLHDAKAAAEKALALDGSISEAHVALADIAVGLDPSPNTALREYQRAISLDASNAHARQFYGFYLIALGRFDDAIVQLKRAEELDPLTPKTKNNLGVAYYFAGHYDTALEWFRQVPDPDVDSERRHRRMAEIYQQKGMQKEAIAEYETSLKFGGKAGLATQVEQTYISSGYAEAQKTLLHGEIEWAERRARRGIVPENAFWIARDCAITGKRDKAIAWLERAYPNLSSGFLDYMMDPRLAGLRADPRVQELAARFGRLP